MDAFQVGFYIFSTIVLLACLVLTILDRRWYKRAAHELELYKGLLRALLARNTHDVEVYVNASPEIFEPLRSEIMGMHERDVLLRQVHIVLTSDSSTCVIETYKKLMDKYWPESKDDGQAFFFDRGFDAKRFFNSVLHAQGKIIKHDDARLKDLKKTQAESVRAAETLLARSQKAKEELESRYHFALGGTIPD
jgi:hypothetical protein